MSFKHFYNESILNEGKWWHKFKEDQVFTLEANGKKYKVCKMDETSSGSPAYVLESRGGHRYGLFRAPEGNFTVIRMKKGKKHLIKPKGGIFKETDGKLIFEADIPIAERNTNVEPCKSFPNGEKSFDNLMDTLNNGVYTDAKA
jgi:hypothetical protein